MFDVQRRHGISISVVFDMTSRIAAKRPWRHIDVWLLLVNKQVQTSYLLDKTPLCFALRKTDRTSKLSILQIWNEDHKLFTLCVTFVCVYTQIRSRCVSNAAEPLY